MTLLGKIFTMLIFVMSIVFMSLALMVFASHKNWPVAAKALKSQLATAKQENAQLQAELERFKTAMSAEQASRAYVLAALQTRLTQMEGQLTEKEGELQKMQANFTGEIAKLVTLSENERALREEVTKLRSDILLAQTERDKVWNEVIAKTDLVHEAEDKLRVLAERNKQLTDQYAGLKRVADLVGVDINTPVSKIPPPLDGVILAINDKDTVEVSIGSDDGLRKGHQMEVFRGANYLGRIEILDIKPNRAIGKIVPQLKKGIIKKDDRVTTRLS